MSDKEEQSETERIISLLGGEPDGDFYSVLSLSKTASSKQIKRAYFKLALIYVRAF
jgi:hypothetical protein